MQCTRFVNSVNKRLWLLTGQCGRRPLPTSARRVFLPAVFVTHSWWWLFFLSSFLFLFYFLKCSCGEEGRQGGNRMRRFQPGPLGMKYTATRVLAPVRECSDGTIGRWSDNLMDSTGMGQPGLHPREQRGFPVSSYALSASCLALTPILRPSLFSVLLEPIFLFGAHSIIVMRNGSSRELPL